MIEENPQEPNPKPGPRPSDKPKDPPKDTKDPKSPTPKPNAVEDNSPNTEQAKGGGDAFPWKADGGHDTLPWKADGGHDHFPWKVGDGGVVVWPWAADNKTDFPLTIKDLIGRPFRMLKKGNMRTMEFVAGRVTIIIDNRGVIDSIEIEPGEALLDR